MTRKLTAIVIDDERLARNEMRALLSHYPEMHVVGEAADISSALTVMRSCKPDVVFLDIKLGRESGLDLLDRFASHQRVVFVTAYDEFAVRAFEVNALDYLLKPVNPARLEQTIQRIVGNSQSDRQVKRLKYEDRIFLRMDDRLQFLKVSDICLIKASGDYSEVILCNGKSSLVSKALIRWEKRLPSKHFVRIHRTMIVNLEQVERIEDWFHQSYRIHLKGFSDPVPVSRRYAARLRRRFE